MALSQGECAHRFGFDVDALQRNEQGGRVPPGPAARLLRVIAADPAVVERAIGKPFAVPETLQSG